MTDVDPTAWDNFVADGDPGSYLEWNGVRAPAINDKDDGSWKKGEPIKATPF